MSMEMGEFHWNDGWYFKRLDDGSVRIRKRESSQSDAPILVEAVVPPLEWCSIASHVTAKGESQNYRVMEQMMLPKATTTSYPEGMGDESRRLHLEYNKLIEDQRNGAKNGAEVVRLTDECRAKGIILVPGGEYL